jgi:hypothetical protein
MRLARMHGVAITAHRPNLFTPTTFYRIIGPQKDRMTGRRQGRHQQTQQNPTTLERAPFRSIQHPVNIREMGVVRATHHAQDRTDRAFPRGQDRADQQNLGMRPHTFRKQWREDRDQAYYIVHGRLPPDVEE